jgi:S1-C subfamily serine protease
MQVDPFAPPPETRPGADGSRVSLTVSAVCLTALVVVAVIVWSVPGWIDRYTAGLARHRYDAAAEFLAGRAESLSYRAVVDKVAPSVVNVNARFPGRSVIYRDWFGRPYRQDTPGQAGQGSGVLVGAPAGDEKGRVFVLTNHHVVTLPIEGSGGVVRAESITLDLPGRSRPLRATVFGLDAGADLALLRIVDPPDDLIPAELGDSDAVAVGDVVLAFGSPFGLRQTVTHGIISAKGRTGVGAGDRVEFLQTSAPVNPGNSGGPLADMAGRVIGINTAIVSRSGGSHGIGFAVPINTAARTIRHFLTHAPADGDPASVRRGWLGVNTRDAGRLPDHVRAQYGIPPAGALIVRVLPGGPAAKAGLLSGDTVTAVDGVAVADAEGLRAAVAGIQVGRVVKLTVVRQGRTATVEVTIEELVAPEEGAAPAEGQ